MIGLRWEDELWWCKVYTSDPPEWLALPWKARGLYALLWRMVDRAGHMQLGKLGRRAVAVKLADAGAWDEIAPLLTELEGCGAVVVEGDQLVLPDYLPAQEAKASPAARVRRSRARQQDTARDSDETEGGAPVTPRFTQQRGATPAQRDPASRYDDERERETETEQHTHTARAKPGALLLRVWQTCDATKRYDTGSPGYQDQVEALCLASAARQDPPADPEQHTAQLLQALVELCDDWRSHSIQAYPTIRFMREKFAEVEGWWRKDRVKRNAQLPALRSGTAPGRLTAAKRIT